MNYVDKIGTEKCFYKVLPKNIGELQSCRTTNPKAEKDSPEARRNQTLMAIGIPVAIAGILAAIFHNSPVFIAIVTIIAIVIIVKLLSNISSFEGEDYFVGSEGYAVANFNGDRSEAKITEYRFEEFADFVSKEVDHYRNRQYEGTEYSKYFYTEVNSEGKRQVVGGWEGTTQKTNEDYLFMKDIESAWSVFHLARIKERYAAGQKISFNVYTDSGYINDYFVFDGETLKVGDRIYDKNTLKDVRIGKGVLTIEHVNHSSKLFGLITKGDQEEIPFSMIANSKVFMLFFEDFYAKVKN